jgi:hypothetical protein
MAKAKSRKPYDDATEDAPRKKHGQPSNFTGARLAFLTEHIPEYLAASKKKGKDAKTEGLAAFWPGFFANYWTCFPWDLPFNQDPHPDAPPPAPLDTAEDVFAALGLNLTPEEEEQKSKIQTETKGVRISHC